MAITAQEVDSMMARAQEQVRAGWMPSRGDYLSTLVTEDKPPLTTTAVEMYVGFYAWLWRREPPPEEVSAVRSRLQTDSYTAFARMDFSIRDAVLARCALWTQIQERSEEEQEAIRSFLVEGTDPGTYPETEGRPGEPEAGTLDEARKQAAATHDQVMDTLQNWPELPR